jgi:ligand-binding sensor domain-containing protein
MAANGDGATRREGRTSKMYDLYVRLCVFAVLAATTIVAGSKPPSADYLRHTFTTEDGLSSNIINDVLQTRDGFLIVATANGVFRFDGHRFAEMNSDPPKGIIAHSLAEGPNGDLWVGTPFGVYRFPHSEIDQRRQTPSVYYLEQGVLPCLRFTRAGVLWAGTPDGLFYFAKDHFQQAAAGRNVHRIEEARNGHLLVTITPGYFEWDGSGVIEHPEIPTPFGTRADGVFHVLQDRTGVTWYCTRKGIFRQSSGSVKLFLPDPTGDKNAALRVYEDTAGNIWFLTEAGLF